MPVAHLLKSNWMHAVVRPPAPVPSATGSAAWEHHHATHSQRAASRHGNTRHCDARRRCGCSVDSYRSSSCFGCETHPAQLKFTVGPQPLRGGFKNRDLRNQAQNGLCYRFTVKCYNFQVFKIKKKGVRRVDSWAFLPFFAINLLLPTRLSIDLSASRFRRRRSPRTAR